MWVSPTFSAILPWSSRASSRALICLISWLQVFTHRHMWLH